MKLFEKVLEEKLRKLIKVDGRQFGFCPGWSATDAIFIMRQLKERFCEKKKKLHVSCPCGPRRRHSTELQEKRLNGH